MAVFAFPVVFTLIVAGNDSVTAPVLPLTLTWFAVLVRLVTPVLFSVTDPPNETLPPPERPVPAVTVTELFCSWALVACPLRLANEGCKQFALPVEAMPVAKLFAPHCVVVWSNALAVEALPVMLSSVNATFLLAVPL